MVGVLSVTKTFARISLIRQEVLFKLLWKGMEWDDHVLGVSNLLELDVRDFLVVYIGWIMSGNISREFWEVGSHILFNLYIL